MNNEKIIVVIPTYNEAKNILNLIEDLKKLRLDILVIDDNSPDKTYDIVEKYSKKSENVYLIKREKKLGLGSAYRDGFNYALKKEYNYIIQMDADFSHRIQDLITMLEFINESDVVIGSRYVTGGKTNGWKNRRKLLSKLANQYSKIIGRHTIQDSTSGFRIYSAKSLEINKFEKTKSDGYGFQIEMTYRSFISGLDIIEVPITFHERREGKSKMNRKIIFEALFVVIKLKFQKM
jgi:dolichol-phosphate mannosyltransferase